MTVLFSAHSAPIYQRGRVTVHERFGYTSADVAHIFDSLCPDDLFEIESVAATPAEARMLTDMASHPYLVRYDGEPVFIGGVHLHRPHYGTVFGFGTDKTRAVIPAVTRYAKRHWLPMMFDAGLTRLEVRLPTRSHRSVHWLAGNLGFNIDCRLPGYGVNDEPHFQLSLTDKQYVHDAKNFRPEG